MYGSLVKTCRDVGHTEMIEGAVKIIATTYRTLAACQVWSDGHDVSPPLIPPPVPVHSLVHVFDRSRSGASCVPDSVLGTKFRGPLSEDWRGNRGSVLSGRDSFSR